MNLVHDLLKGEPDDPPWRIAAYWMVMTTFFTLPLIFWVVDLCNHGQWKANEFSYLYHFHQMLAGLLVSMLGLNSLDRYFEGKNGKNHSGKENHDGEPAGGHGRA